MPLCSVRLFRRRVAILSISPCWIAWSGAAMFFPPKRQALSIFGRYRRIISRIGVSLPEGRRIICGQRGADKDLPMTQQKTVGNDFSEYISSLL